MFVPWLEAEADAATLAVAEATNRTEAIGSFVHAVAGFHLADLDRFRMMYLVPQATRDRSNDRGQTVLGEPVYSVTSRLYGALADHLDGEQAAKRKEAVAIHSAVPGLVLMVALADALHDPLKHTEYDLVKALIASLVTN